MAQPRKRKQNAPESDMAPSRKRPKQNAPQSGLEKIASELIGSTKKIMVNLNKALFNISMDLPDTHPLVVAIKKFTLLNAKTAQLTDNFLALPDARTMRDQVESGLGKLKSIPTPVAKQSSELFSSQFKGPSENVNQSLDSLEAIRKAYHELKNDQHERLGNLLDRIANAPDPVSMAKSQDIVNEFASQETRRSKISSDLTGLDKSLRGTLTQLSSLFTQIYNSIPLTERKGIAPISEREQQRPGE